MTETINGLHSCKPENEPIEGQVKTFVIEHRPAVGNKKAWIKIKSAGEKFGGTPFRILSVSPTGFTDDHGNVSFNLEIEPSSSTPTAFQNARATMQQGRVPLDELDAQQGETKRFSMLDERQRAIIRQHSQSMALEVLKLKVTLNELTVVDLTPVKLKQLADYFDNDVFGAT